MAARCRYCTVMRRDLKQKVIHPVLSRPMLRLHYVIGHLLGLAASVAGAVALWFVALQAGMYALRERRVHVTQEDFDLATAKILNKHDDKEVAVSKLWK